MSSSSGLPDADALAILIPNSEAAVIRHFPDRMPYGLFMADVNNLA